MRLKVYQAVSYLLEGYSFEQTADIFECSHQTVRSRWKDFEEKVMEVGLMEAAKKCNVVEEINELRKLANSIKKKEATLDECVSGNKIATQLVKLGHNPEALNQFLVDLYQYSKTKNISGEALGHMAHRLHSSSAAYGLEYPELVDKMERLNVEKDEIESRISELENTIEKLSEEHKQKLVEANVTDEKLDIYLDDKKVLEEEADLKIDNIKKISKSIKEFNKHDFNVKKIIELVNKHDSLTEHIKGLEKTVEKVVVENNRVESEKFELLEQKKNIKEEITNLVNTHMTLQTPLKALKELNKKDIFTEEMVALRDITKDAGLSFVELKASIETLGGLEGIRKTKTKKITEYESVIIQLDKKAQGLKDDIGSLKERKKNLIEDTKNTLKEFDLRIKSITNQFNHDINDPEKGLQAAVLRSLNKSLESADFRLSGFEKESIEKIERIQSKADAVHSRVLELETKLKQCGVELVKYKFLENLSKLFLGEEIPKPEKRLIMVTLMELLEKTMKYEGLIEEAIILEQLKKNVFRGT